MQSCAVHTVAGQLARIRTLAEARIRTHAGRTPWPVVPATRHAHSQPRTRRPTPQIAGRAGRARERARALSASPFSRRGQTTKQKDHGGRRWPLVAGSGEGSTRHRLECAGASLVRSGSCRGMPGHLLYSRRAQCPGSTVMSGTSVCFGAHAPSVHMRAFSPPSAWSKTACATVHRQLCPA
jgi:hypothetical protein